MSAKVPKKAKDAGGAAKAKGGKKKLLLAGLAVLLLGGGGAGAWATGVVPKLLGKGSGAEEAGAEPHAAKPAGGHGAAPAAAGAHGGGHGVKADAKTEAKVQVGGPLFMDLPDIVANINAGPRRTSYVKLKAKIELSRPEDQAAIQAAMPRVLDLFQGYLREMRPEELRGSAGTYRLREELLARTNLAAPPARAVAVLFTEMIVQ